MRIWKKWIEAGSLPLNSRQAAILVACFMTAWVFWQCWGIEVMRPPWEDETAYTLPGTNWVQGQGFKLPQWTGFYGSEVGWRWHMPLFSILIAVWQKWFGISLLSIRLFTLLPAALAIAVAAILCRILTGQHTVASLLFWLVLLSSDKVFIANSVMGRMEFHAVLFALLSLAVVLAGQDLTAALTSGALLGLGCGFHPLVAFFGPVLAGLIWWRRTLANRLLGVVGLAVGFSVPMLAYAIWFCLAWPLTHAQFLTAVRQSSGPLGQNARDFISGFFYYYRMQPAFEVAAAICLALLAVQSIRKRDAESSHWKPWALVAAFACYGAFLLRGSTNHYYYYVPLSFLLYFSIAFEIAVLLKGSGLFRRRLVFSSMALLLLNNLAFAAGKTYVIWENRSQIDDRPMRRFLSQQTAGTEKILVPPNLWLVSSQNHWNYRLVYTPVMNTSSNIWTAYHSQLLAWDPDVIILDARMLPPTRSSLTPQAVQAAGYVKTGEFSRVFRGRYDPYSGYQLIVYRKRTATAPALVKIVLSADEPKSFAIQHNSSAALFTTQNSDRSNLAEGANPPQCNLSLFAHKGSVAKAAFGNRPG